MIRLGLIESSSFGKILFIRLHIASHRWVLTLVEIVALSELVARTTVHPFAVVHWRLAHHLRVPRHIGIAFIVAATFVIAISIEVSTLWINEGPISQNEEPVLIIVTIHGHL